MNSTSTANLLAALRDSVTDEFDKARPLLPTYLHLVVSAVFPIITASYASLARPPSAAPAAKRRPGSKRTDDDEEEEELSPKLETLSVSDAVLFPILAGITLATLYVIIKWLEDPALLNRILGVYFSWVGFFFTYKFIKDILGFFRSIVFPTQYSSGGLLWKVNSDDTFTATSTDGKVLTRASPLPSFLGAAPLPLTVSSVLWAARNTLYRRRNLDLRTSSPLPKSRLRLRLNPAIDFTAFALSFGLLVYQLLPQTSKSKPWYLTNLSGFSFCHGSLQFLTPGTSGVGTLLLSLLFCYDIYMVFFTPMMVTVATKLDVPIKLLFPKPSGCMYPVGAGEGSKAMQEYVECVKKARTMAMLGLGDIVIPGMMVAFALRFDLYKFYLNMAAKDSTSSPAMTTRNRSKKDQEKPTYAPARGSWGERLWTSRSHQLNEPDCKSIRAKQFPQTYFYASIAGYIIGMVVTMLVMQVFQHAQPALLYLVPGVLLSIWSTALVQGDVKRLWAYDESGEEEEKENKKEKEESKQEEKTSEESDQKRTEQGGGKTDDKKSKLDGGIKFTFASLTNFSFSVGSIMSCSLEPIQQSSSSSSSSLKSATATTSTSQKSSLRARSRSRPRKSSAAAAAATATVKPVQSSSSNNANGSISSSPELISKEDVLEAGSTGIVTRSRTGEPSAKKRRKA